MGHTQRTSGWRLGSYDEPIGLSSYDEPRWLDSFDESNWIKSNPNWANWVGLKLIHVFNESNLDYDSLNQLNLMN